MHHNITLYTKLIGIAATIFCVQKTAIAKNLVEVDSIAGVIPPVTKSDRQQLNPIAQNTLTKVDEYNRLARRKYEQGDYQGALADLNRALQLEPNNVRARLGRGAMKVRVKDYQGALADFNRAIQLEPNSAKGYINRGGVRSLQFQGIQDNKGALADLNRAIQLDPSDADAYNNRSLLRYHNLKDRSGAITDLQKVAQLLRQQGNRKEAQRVMGIVKQWQSETKRTGTL